MAAQGKLSIIAFTRYSFVSHLKIPIETFEHEIEIICEHRPKGLISV